MPSREEVLHGPGTLDDAGVVRIPGTDKAIVQTVDFFPPIVDDPREFGRIAAANSLSDIYAMGGLPLSALNIVGFPEELPMTILGEILSGGAEKMEEANCALLGGHSVRDAEIKYGLAVTGTIDPDHMLTNGGARAGDVLVLTKSLGTGTVSTALNKSEVDADILATATTSMSTLNAAAAQIAMNHGVKSATDVTGFGRDPAQGQSPKQNNDKISINSDFYIHRWRTMKAASTQAETALVTGCSSGIGRAIAIQHDINLPQSK